MNEQKMLELQFLMKQNQADAMDFIADLKGWTAEVKEKERQLKTASENPKSLSLDQKSKVSKKLASNTETDEVPSYIVKPITKSRDEASKKNLVRINVREVFAEDDAIYKSPSESKVDTNNLSTTESNSIQGKPSENGHLCENIVAGDCLPHLKLHESDMKSGCAEKLVDSEAITRASHRVPTSSFQFQADWKRLRAKPGERGVYLKNIDSISFHKIFGESLEPEMLSGIIIVANQYFKSDPVKIYEILKRLSEVSRFSTMIMFLPTSDKTILRGLFQLLDKCSSLNDKEVKLLRELYGVE